MNAHQSPAAPAGLLLVLSTAATWALVDATGALRHPSTLAFDDLLAAFAAWLLVGCAGWSVLICAAAVLEATTAGRLPATTWVGCPTTVRRLLLAGLGVALVTVPGQPWAATAAGSAAGSGSPGMTHRGALPVPVRPLGAAHSHAGPLIVVQPGDTLWQLATDRLPALSPVGEVADLVERLHHRNRRVVGPDPDLILPGQRLAVPARHHQEHDRHHQHSRHLEEQK